ncbi:T7SS effector LXG polymorphic toxin [Bacillus haynesii]|uniref:T7SS effector LXG polymorphic toxin n=1 Tax=Bacillus haynesii TaxID=1925021 RepID=UPI002282D22F|nr:T7SS effector LXG polymorphic toxin [Bacillus haynesii]MCY7999392.1 T7SS effector LXG polymorphic toxin [Bacillus haynesii]MCY8013677.1 T7SS effector LXG polymorphic toxin [Bacillus haynesii]
MKTLDVQALHNAIDQTLEQLKQQSDEFAKVKKAVEGITSLDDALKGKGGDAIRAFYEECHTPFLQFYDTFIEEYSSTLKKMKSALNSLEPNQNGFISQTFLEHKLENGVNAANRTTKRLVSKTNATIAKVSHIVDLSDLNDSDFHEQNQKALKEISTTLEKLHAFDREQTNGLKTAENDLETMQKYIARLEKMYTGPKIEITGYQKGAILKPDDNTKANGLPGGLQGQLENVEPSPMEMMLEKLNKNKRSNVDTVIREDNKENINQDVHANDFDLNALQKEVEKHPKVYGDIRVIDGKLYNHKGWKVVTEINIPDEAVQDHSDPNFIGGKYSVYENGQIVRTYIANDKEEVMVVDRIPEARGAASAKINDSYFEGTPLEILEYLNLGNAGRTLTTKAIKKVGKGLEKEAEKIVKKDAKSNTSKSVGKQSKTPSYGKHSVPKGPYREVHGFPAKVKPGAQEKHIPGTPNYKQEIANGRKNKSIFYGDNKKAQELLDKFAGKGDLFRKDRERIECGQVIGKYYDHDAKKYVETTRGIIHYGKNGAHIVPSHP